MRIAAFGDIMMHMPQIRAGMQPDGSYDFRPFFKEIKPYLRTADLAIGNLETTLAGKSKPYSGYPRFNSPDELLDALSDAGVDIVSTANNHALDTGEKGVIRTYQRIKQKGIQATGTSPSPKIRQAAYLKKNGIILAFLAYTQSTNGLPVPKDKPYLINLIDREQIAKDIKRARQQGADFVCVSLHFGIEYQRRPDAFQIQTARQVLANGADIVLGSHPHVLQPIEKIRMNGKEKWIVYSLGNFISNQAGPFTDEGVILYFDVAKDPVRQQTVLKNVSFLPTYVHKYRQNGKRQYVILPVENRQPKQLPSYPGISMVKWRTVWDHVQKQMKRNGSLPACLLKCHGK
ncbi:CapA family protein [Lihuaxuella thermophila]|uniref:CapA family protein n=1 Tax=Lihuaxuella thermophila TaxID=1173111 RepID=UPI00147A17C1|nr:CapA family protein [Lihuaxuella thermophila]